MKISVLLLMVVVALLLSGCVTRPMLPPAEQAALNEATITATAAQSSIVDWGESTP